MKIDPFVLRARPDQASYTLNGILDQLNALQYSIKVMSEDKKNVIIIGNQPINPNTGKPYPFGIHTFRVLGDRLEEI